MMTGPNREAIALVAECLAVGVESAMASELLNNEQRTPAKRERVAASAFHECPARMLLDMVEGDERPPWSEGQLSNFRRGHDRETSIRQWLEAAGRVAVPSFEVTEKDVNISFRENNDARRPVIINGYIDGVLKFDDGTRAVYETKSWADHIVKRIECFDDLLLQPWTKAAAYQLAAYVWGREVELGFMVLDRRNAVPKVIGVTLEECAPLAERFLKAAERARRLRTEWIETPGLVGLNLDEIMEPDKATCGRCWCNGVVCFPPNDGGPGADVETDEELIHAAEVVHENANAKADYDRAWKRLRERFHGVEVGIVGEFVVRGKWSRRTSYNVPDSIKAPYKAVSEHGAFTLSLEKPGTE